MSQQKATHTEVLERFNEIRPRYSSDPAAHEALRLEFGYANNGVVRRKLTKARKAAPAPAIPFPAVFPDKKKAQPRTYEVVLTEIKRAQEYGERTSLSQDEATWIPRPEYPALPVALTWMPDVHWGSKGVDYGFLESHLKTVRETPNMYAAFGGDLVDNYSAIKHPSGIWGDAVTPEDQFFGLADLLTRMDADGKLAAIVWGNHDEWSALAGINPFSTFFRHVSCPLFIDGGGELHTNVGGHTYHLGLRHVFWGHSKLNLTNSPKRMIQFWRTDLDAAFTGHVHYAAGEDFVFAGQQRVACVGGTYKLFDSFGKRWVGDAQPGGFTLLMYPDRKLMQLCRYPELAADIILGKIARLKQEVTEGDVLAQAA